MLEFKILDDRYTIAALGHIPDFLSEEAPGSARTQLHYNYLHGGGWSPLPGWRMGPVGEIMYPGSPPFSPIAIATLRDEIIRIYPYAWVSITQPDGEFEVARMD